jgi:hypothetical protein
MSRRVRDDYVANPEPPTTCPAWRQPRNGQGAHVTRELRVGYSTLCADNELAIIATRVAFGEERAVQHFARTLAGE